MAAPLKKSAEHTLYHLSPKGFWKKFRDAVVVNPEISSGLPLQDRNRYPQPASRPEKYATPATLASDPAQNPYWKRDVRRAYPQLSVVTQSELSTFLVQSPENQALPKPGETQEAGVSTAASTTALQPPTDLSATIASLPPTFSADKLPPTFPVSFKRWTPQPGEEIPHDKNAYFPMTLVN